MLWKIIFFVPGAAIGFILSTAISQVDQPFGLVVSIMGIVIGGSITTTIGKILFLRAEYEGQKSGGIAKVIIRILIIGIVIVAALLALGKSGIIR